MTWHICYLKQPYVPDRPHAETWDVDSKEYAEPGDAITAITYRLGVETHGALESNGMWRVTNSNGWTVAVIRETPDTGNDLVAQPNQIPEPGKNGLSPLRRWRGLTWVGWMNYLVLRWFRVRIVYTVEDDGSISRYQLRFWKTWKWS